MTAAAGKKMVQASDGLTRITHLLAPCSLAAAALGLAPMLCAGQESSVSPAGARINTSVFDCPGQASHEPFELTVRRGPGELALWLPFSFGIPYVVLSRDFDVDGETYREADLRLDLTASGASLTVGDDEFSDCVINPLRSVWEHAELSGIDYRASGTDPHWYLEIRRRGPLVFALESGNTYFDVPTPEPEYDALRERTVYRSQVGERSLVVEIDNPSCAPEDGAPIGGSSVVVRLDTQTYSGCGRALN